MDIRASSKLSTKYKWLSWDQSEGNSCSTRFLKKRHSAVFFRNPFFPGKKAGENPEGIFTAGTVIPTAS
jgi:hypothetical protein